MGVNVGLVFLIRSVKYELLKTTSGALSMGGLFTRNGQMGSDTTPEPTNPPFLLKSIHQVDSDVPSVWAVKELL